MSVISVLVSVSVLVLSTYLMGYEYPHVGIYLEVGNYVDLFNCREGAKDDSPGSTYRRLWGTYSHVPQTDKLDCPKFASANKYHGIVRPKPNPDPKIDPRQP